MMRKVLLVGFLGAALAVGLFIIGCSKDSGGGGDADDPGPKYSITGTITLSDGPGKASASVSLYRSDPYINRSVYANENGAYTISGVTPGEYKMTVAMLDYALGNGTVVVTDSDVTGKDFVLYPQTSSPSSPSSPSSFTCTNGRKCQGTYGGTGTSCGYPLCNVKVGSSGPAGTTVYCNCN